MPTTFNWISLGIPRNITGTPVFVDPLDTVAGAENAAGLLTAQNSSAPRVFGSAGSPLYNSITSATMINRSGDANVLDTNTAIGAQVDQFSTNVGAGPQTFNFAALVNYTGIVTYADGSTASGVTLQLVQAGSGELFLAPPATTGSNPALTAKPIQSIQLTAVANDNVNLLLDRQLGVFDDGFIDGTAGNDSIVGGYIEPGTGGSDQIDSGDGLSGPGTGFNDDQIRAGAGNDTIDGGLGNDLIDAGDGNDLVNLTGTFGNDTITGGLGSDTLSGATLTGASTVTFNGGSGTFVSGGSTATFNTIEAVTTGSGADTVTISGTAAGTFATGAGADTINAGGSGADSINAGDGDDLVNLSGAFGSDTITGGAGSDTLSGATLTGASTVTFNGGSGTFASGGSTASFNTIEAITTGTGADTVNITGSVAGAFATGAGADTINAGGSGADSINTGDGDDLVNLTGTFGNDTITGGSGSDTLAGATLTGGSTVTFNGGSGTFANGGSTASFNTVEAITTGTGADTVTISGVAAGAFATGAGADTINAGGSGADIIDAGDGDDLVNLTGAFGSDTITGGAGSDTLSGATLTGASNVTFNGGTGTFANGGSTASFNTVEAITTGAGADTVTISGVAAGAFATGAGADTINAGGSGADIINAGDGDDLVNLTGVFGNDTITGGAGSDTLSGATLTGASTVTFNGGSGTFASGGSTASFNTIEAITTGAGADTVTISGTVAGSFATGAGADTINAGGSGADTINAGDGDDLINLTGTFGSDTITGGAGSDTLSGATLTGASTVTFTNGTGTFANGGSTASFNTIEAITTGAGADTVNAATNTSAASFALGAGNDSFTGGLGAETIDGGAGDDTIVSGGGADVVSAGDGQDLVDAGEGNDYVDAGAGNDTVAGGAGNDTLLGGTGDDQLSGGTGDDSLLGGAGNDVLLGGDGNDYLDGGPGADTLTGGAGNDVFVVSNGDLITDFTTGDPANNDSVDLTAFYNDDNLAIINAQRVSAGLTPYNSALGWLRADQADDGVLNSIRTDAGFAENVTLRIQNGGTAVTAAQLTEDSTSVLCFGSDALIQTVDGPVPAGALKVGDMVMTRDNGAQPIRWIGQRVIDAAALADRPALAPIRIRAGALGQALPSSDLIVSPQHRILVRSKIAERMFGTPEVLVAAKQLMVSDGIDVADDLAEVTYVHFLFDDHQIVLSNGAETESLYTGAEALKSIPAEARAEIMALFPERVDGTGTPAVRLLLSGRMGRKLAQRHAQNGKALVA
ncbi:Hint domain-containing protein [Paracoccus marcusii]|uniref:Hint domain-containing protein n=1 Tax=Paracoccus marcusii TaxID=59779 RepID=UPI003267D3BE